MKLAKRVLRSILEGLFAKTPSEIGEILKASSASVISFDIFDTLVERLVDRPEDVFVLLETDFRKAFHKDLPIARLRKHAEARARTELNLSDVTLEEIYSVMDVTDTERAWLVKREIELETTLLFPKKSMLPIYGSAVTSGKRVVLTSDMYLPESVLVNILAKCGIRGYSHIYLSSIERKTKRDGTLFKEISNREGVPFSSILHIGDNARSDFLVPRSLGIHTALLKLHRRKHAGSALGILEKLFLCCMQNCYSDL